MIEPPFHEVMKASCQGALELARGDYSKSIQAFRRAVVYLKRTVDGDGTLSCLQSWRLTTMSVLQTEQLLGNNVGISCETFDRCFLLVPMPCPETIPSNDKAALIGSALLYNIALAYQLQAASNPSKSSTSSMYNDMSMRMYNRASQLLQGHLDGSSDGAALLLAISNNMATLALERLDWTAFATHRTNMRKYLNVTTTVTGTFHSSFFAGNYAATENVHKRPAPAA